MTDRLDLQGHFWRPGDEEREKWSGRLVDEPARGVVVTAAAPDQHDLVMESFAPLVVGRTVDQCITMTDVRLYPSMKLPGGTELTMRPWRTFVGRVQFEQDEEIAFDRFTLRVDALDEWANRSGFGRTTVLFKPRDRITVEYERPEPIDVAQVGDIRIRIVFRSDHSRRGVPQVGVEIAQEAEFEFAADGRMPYETLESLSQHVRNFVMFAARQRVDVVYTRGYWKDDADLERPAEPIEIVSRNYGLPDHDLPSLDEHGLLFRRDQNGEPPESRLDRWLALQDEDELGPVFNLYLAGLYQPRSFVEFRFLALAQAAESLHSRRVKRQPYGTAIVGLVKRLPPGVRHMISDVGKVARKVEVTRNYHTHWNPAERDEAATTVDELDGLAKALRCVLEALLLLELGFTIEEADRLLEKNLNYRRELRRGLEATNLA